MLRFIVILGGVLALSTVFASDSAAKQEPSSIPIISAESCIDFDSSSDCWSGDVDGDGYADWLEERTGSDAHNAESTSEYALLDEQQGWNTCGDKVDNDLDGLTDEGDAGCRLNCKDFGPNDRCKDSDKDGWLAYVEQLYGSDPASALSTPETAALPGTCADGIDNDLDGFTDEADSGCVPAGCIDFSDMSCEPF